LGNAETQFGESVNDRARLREWVAIRRENERYDHCN
jgi:hypothetical protein